MSALGPSKAKAIHKSVAPIHICWGKTLTLKERLATVDLVDSPRDESRYFLRRIQVHEARGFLPERESIVNSWCRELQCDPSTFKKLIAVRGAAWEEAVSSEPAWVRTIRKICLLYETDAFDSSRDLCMNEGNTLAAFAWPWIRYAQLQAIEAVPGVYEAAAWYPGNRDLLVQMFLPELRNLLYFYSDRTLTLQMNIARLQGRLKGSTSEERHRYYCAELTTFQTANEILREYPVLARLITEATERWIANTRQFLASMYADWPEIHTKIFSGADIGRLSAVTSGEGDYHRGGRSVIGLSFDSGHKLVYKPRSTACERAFNKILEWTNQNTGAMPLRTYIVLDCGDHGWCEFVEARPCASEEERHRFFHRQGELAAIAWALRLTDLNSENILAAGDNPVIVDPECALQPDELQISLEGIALRQSILKSHLLPSFKIGTVDISGIGGRGNQEGPFRTAMLEGGKTDTARIVNKHPMMRASNNLPVPDGEEILCEYYADDAIEGFLSMHQALASQGETLIESEEFKELSTVEIRVVLRKTVFYGLLLRSSLHPNLLRDAIDREVVFSRLWDIPERNPDIVSEERAELWQGDIPCFGICDSRDLISPGSFRVVDYFGRHPARYVEDRIRELRSEETARHVWTIRSSLHLNAAEPAAVDWKPQVGSEIANLAETCLSVATQIGDRILGIADQGASYLYWMDVVAIEGKSYSRKPTTDRQLVPMGADLYSGLSGMLLFLHYLGQITKQERFQIAAQKLRRSVIDGIGGRTYNNTTVGVAAGPFKGAAGVLYTLLHCGASNDQAAMEACGTLLQQIAASIGNEQRLDFGTGASGSICVLLECYSRWKNRAALEIAVQAGETLLAQAQYMQRGIAWPAGDNSTPLTGFAHGASGIAYALARLFEITGDPRILQVVKGALEFERNFFVPDVGNWRDLRDWARGSEAELTGSLGWCHGAPGIGWSRLEIGKILHQDLDVEAESACRTAIRVGRQGSDCLCHGTLGNLDFVMSAARELAKVELSEAATHSLRQRLIEIGTNGFRFETGQETLNFMTGLAGCGYAMLRFANPLETPSVLLLKGTQVCPLPRVETCDSVVSGLQAPIV